MKRKLFFTKAVMVMMCCLAVLMSGCNSSTTSVDNTDYTNTETPTANDEAPMHNTPSSGETEPPETKTAPQINSGEITNVRILLNGLEVTWEGRDELPAGTYNGVYVPAVEGNYPAVIIDDVVLVPAGSGIFEILPGKDGSANAGFQIISGFDRDNTSIFKVFIENAEYSVEITEGELFFTSNGETIPLTVPAQRVYEEVFMIPLIPIMEAIGATVETDETAQIISISY